ncbi:hypothetical protein [Asanoa iriomotensis]|uniref:Uncharacterized protein n=1 Tax=Asanoa iriomotensis TaxID=234613 RepID=A0ABQ4CG10_9ACTN|nr:hypothetical protein [Asanoa iriomotensis]GIF61717.1 hypothetical protein Air01nite_78120 [Asanoa iriomotensis]
MKPRYVPLVIVGLVLIALLTAYSTQQRPSTAYASASSSATRASVVDFQGVSGAPLGATDADLTSQGAMAKPANACGPVLTGVSEAHPVFADGQLVLLWANPPLKTPEGVGVGTSLAAAKAAYPQATAMVAPAGSYQFDGLMVTSGDKAYLFMHDGHTVRKTVVGYTDDVQRLFTHGVGNC